MRADGTADHHEPVLLYINPCTILGASQSMAVSEAQSIISVLLVARSWTSNVLPRICLISVLWVVSVVGATSGLVVRDGPGTQRLP